MLILLKMVKTKFFYVYAFLCIVSIQSCKEGVDSIVPIETAKKEIAIEILQAKRNVQYSEPIYLDQNEEFFKGAYVQSLPKELKSSKLEQIDGYDVISSADEIPMVSLVELTQTIFTDGSFTYSSIDITPDELDFLENLHPTLLTPEERVYRTEIENNVLTLYSTTGNLVSSEYIGEVNFKPMLDSLVAFLASEPSKAGVSSNKTRQAAASKAIANAAAYGMRVISQSQTEVVMEMDMDMGVPSLSNSWKAGSTQKAIMRFSHDLTRMFSQKIYEGDQLVQSLEIGFASESEPNFANSLSGFDSHLLPNANVKFVKQKRLAVKPDGTPIVMNFGEIYSKNIVKYHLNQ